MTQTAALNAPYTQGDHTPYISLSFGKLDFLVPQSCIVAVETVSDISVDETGDNAAPYLSYNDSKLPVYSFSDQLDIERPITSDQTICVILKYNDTHLALMCTEAIPFKHDIAKLVPLPDCMKARPNPIESICLRKIGDETAVNFVISAGSLFKYIDQCDT